MSENNEMKAVLDTHQNSGYSFDVEIAQALAEIAAKGPMPELPKRGDWKALRELGNTNMIYWASLAPTYEDVQQKTYFTRSHDKVEIELRWYTKDNNSPGSAVVYAHGGGMVLGDLDKYDCVLSHYVHLTGVPFLSVGYRIAPEAQGESLALDTFAGITWLLDHASALNVDPARIAIMGDSAGGGVAAGAAILARDRRVNLARQILIYPMLDDRNMDADGHLVPFSTWTYDNNFTGWSALLGEQFGSDNVSPVAAPARLTDFSGLSRAYIEVGELDIFRDENLVYAQKIASAGIPIELHVHTGAPHGYDRLAPNSGITSRAMADRIRIINSI